MHIRLMFLTKLFLQSCTRKLVYQLPKSTSYPITSTAAKTAFSTTKMAKGMTQEYKLKGLSKLDLKPGEKREVEVEGVEDGKVLLMNVNGKHSALGSKCTHYGAPLIKGVLTGDGRITCPWHGACFNATTGDIENAPAIDHLPAFGLREDANGVYLETKDPQLIKGSRRKPNIKCAPSSPESVVIIGGGSATIGCVEGLREEGFKGAITVISSEGYLPIDRTKLSKALINDAKKVELRDQEWYNSAGINTVTDEVSSVDFLTKKVMTKSGKDFPYTKLVIATGGTPRNLPLEGFKDLENIFQLRTIHHVKDIVSAIGDKGKKIVIIGSSFIGMEVANATGKDNQVTVVGMEKVPLERVMGEKVGAIFQKQLEENGVKFKMSAGVEKAVPSEKDPKKVGEVVLKDGTRLEADLVILGVGVAPATTFLKDNKSVKLEDDSSLLVDDNFAVKGLNDVYALGDIATYPYHGPGGNGNPVRIEHWDVAQNAGRAAASHIVDKNCRPKPFVPIFWSALGAQLRYCGNSSAGFDDVVIQGNPEEYKFAAYYTKGDDVIAVASMQKDPVMTMASELMRRGAMPGKIALQGGMDITTMQVPAEVTMPAA